MRVSRQTMALTLPLLRTLAQPNSDPSWVCESVPVSVADAVAVGKWCQRLLPRVTQKYMAATPRGVERLRGTQAGMRLG